MHACTQTQTHTHTPTTPRTHSHPHSASSDCPREGPQRRWPESELLARQGSPISWLLLHHQMVKMRSFQRCRLLDHWNGNVPFHKTFPIKDNIKFWTRAWQPTPVFLPGEFHRQRNLASYIPGGSQRVGVEYLSITKDIPVWAAIFIQQVPTAVSPGHSSGTGQLRHLQDWFFQQTHWERLFLMFLHGKKKAASQLHKMSLWMWQTWMVLFLKPQRQAHHRNDGRNLKNSITTVLSE